MNSDTDRIVKQVLLSAPQERVWEAISDSQQFGRWFGMKLDGPFVAGEHLKGEITATEVDAEIAKMQAPHTGTSFDLFVETIEPMRLFSFRWHPYAVDTDADYSDEPTTLVTFELERLAPGTQLTITESGFDQVPIDRRAEAFASNEEGWTIQARLIEKYLSREA